MNENEFTILRVTNEKMTNLIVAKQFIRVKCSYYFLKSHLLPLESVLFYVRSPFVSYNILIPENHIKALIYNENLNNDFTSGFNFLK